MKKEQPFTISQTLLLVYIMCLGFFIVILGVIAFFKLKLWLMGVIIGLPLAIWGGLKIHEYLFEGGLERDFITKKK
jgi:uncharacterized membrane-anchored protein